MRVVFRTQRKDRDQLMSILFANIIKKALAHNTPSVASETLKDELGLMEIAEEDLDKVTGANGGCGYGNNYSDYYNSYSNYHHHGGHHHGGHGGHHHGGHHHGGHGGHHHGGHGGHHHGGHGGHHH
ncbi:hypothetical protein KTT_35060 [Tengunoibacter tsumagoiensis]|uniref:Uncharacterized protein n=2 Tax=Tengunoibacter tsumagoiensis TaxID=2014871 RepID=A0A402A3B5_9CHLR|nr:hypothetical protein KTT_35060 [Tengunoibacter tsumagoiensis]